MYKKIRLLALMFLSCVSLATAQTENSPFSRYGLGNPVPFQNIINRGMGGFSAAYGDYQSVNFSNPASYSRLKATVLDIGVEVNTSTLKAIDPPRKFSSASPNISYVTIGIPLSRKRDWGLAFGLRPMSRVSYEIERRDFLTSGTLGDSAQTIFQGDGGSQQVFGGMGFGIKNLKVGINFGYLFGSKNVRNALTFLSDSVLYYQSAHSTKTSYGGALINAGLQYTIKLKNTTRLHVGAFGNLQQSLNASQDVIRETVISQENGPVRVDSIYEQKDIGGKILYPSSFGFGLMLDREAKWMIGADFTQTNWVDYRFYGEKDFLQNSWQMHLGGQIIPNAFNAKSYWNRVAYRAGFNLGADYVNVDGERPTYSVSFGMGLPMRPPAYTKQFAVINLTLEYGKRGDKSNTIRENFFALALGLNLSDIWFQKRKYY
jgi:hypothetical protein